MIRSKIIFQNSTMIHANLVSMYESLYLMLRNIFETNKDENHIPPPKTD